MNIIKFNGLRFSLFVAVGVLSLIVEVVNADIPTNGPYPFTVPGIGTSSYPFFLDQGGTITISEVATNAGSYWNLTGTGTMTAFLGNPTDSVTVGLGDSVEYQANFNVAGQLITSIGTSALSNFLTISGALPAGSFGGTTWVAQPNQLLLSATLSGINNVNTPDAIGIYNNSALGFNTTFTGGWVINYPGFTGGSSGENLWLFSPGTNLAFNNLIDALNGNRALTAVTISNISSVAAVPISGAFWMFFSGLSLLAFSSRKYNIQTLSAV